MAYMRDAAAARELLAGLMNCQVRQLPTPLPDHLLDMGALREETGTALRGEIMAVWKNRYGVRVSCPNEKCGLYADSYVHLGNSRVPNILACSIHHIAWGHGISDGLLLIETLARLDRLPVNQIWSRDLGRALSLARVSRHLAQIAEKR